MKEKFYNKLIFLSIFFIILIFIIPARNEFKETTQNLNSKIDMNLNPLSSDSWSNFTFIHITNLNWSIAETYDWCQGNGTITNPYIIENLTINASTSPTKSGIYIENSANVYFIIRNNTIINAGTLITDGAIKLKNCENGTLILNNCSNSQSGIILQNSEYNL